MFGTDISKELLQDQVKRLQDDNKDLLSKWGPAEHEIKRLEAENKKLTEEFENLKDTCNYHKCPYCGQWIPPGYEHAYCGSQPELVTKRNKKKQNGATICNRCGGTGFNPVHSNILLGTCRNCGNTQLT